jgi:hypothetical protein
MLRQRPAVCSGKEQIMGKTGAAQQAGDFKEYTSGTGFVDATTWASQATFADWIQVIGAGSTVVTTEAGVGAATPYNRTITTDASEPMAVLHGPFSALVSSTAARVRMGVGAPPALIGAGPIQPYQSLTRAQILALTLPATGLTIYDLTNNIVTTNTGTPASPVWSRQTGGPNVSATVAGGQSIPNNAATVMTGWTAAQNTGSAFVAATGVFTAPVAGFYEFEAGCQFTATASAAATEFRCSLNKNGTPVTSGVQTSHTAGSVVKQTCNVEFSLQLAAGDLITISAFQNNGSAITLTSDGTANFFAAELVQ